MDKLKMHSLDGVKRNIERIGKLFPNAVTEVMRGGKVEHAIDFDVLRQELSDEIVEGREERYQFTWPDKKKAMLAANAPITATLRPIQADSVGRDGTPGGFDSENLYIEGDNLEVLKLLQETYLSKVKMIYIDPPYNTGNDFVYEDDFAQSTNEYMENSGQYDEEGNRMVSNTESNGRFHTDWLNMMYPRLKLAKDLLAEDGIIFISIDDNEQENLKKICDEVFGFSNFIATYLKQSKIGGGSDSRFIVKEHEYCYVYAKNITIVPEMFMKHDEEYLKRYKDKDDEGYYFWDTFARPGLKNPIHYDIVAPDGTVMDYGWIHGKERYEQELKEGKVRIVQKNGGGWSVQFKQYLNLSGKKPRSMTMDFGGSIEGKNDISSLFDSEKIFSYPKSTKFIKILLSTIINKNALVLDFFSGSATTAHAVMQLNAEDGGHRKFIMVQLPEKTDEKSEAYKAGYENICEIGKERIRRAGRKIKEEAGLAVSADLDIGFRCLRLSESNMENVYYAPEDTKQEDLFHLVDNVKPDRTPEDLLFQVMLDLGVLLSSAIEVEEMAGKKVFNVAEGFLLACFDHDVTEETVKAIAQRKPYYTVFRDSSMDSDSVAANFDQIFETYSPDTIRKVL